MISWVVRIGFFCVSLLLVSLLCGQRAEAQEQGLDQDNVTLLATPQQEDSLSGTASTHKKRKKKPLTFDHHLSFAEGLHPQDNTVAQSVPSDTSPGGVAVNYYLRAGVRVLHKDGNRKLSISAEYTHDPFTLRTFSFDPDEQLDRTARIVQLTDEIKATFVWRQRLLPKLRSALWVRGGARFAESGIFDRRDAGLRYDLRMGRFRGLRGLISVEGRALLYPNYLVNNRRLDQWLLRAKSTVGYRWGRIILLELSYRPSFNPYMNSRYDALDSGLVVSATKNKSHVNHRLEPALAIEPVDGLRIDLAYRFERNDSRNYDRSIRGSLPDLTPGSRFITDYYDFTRHRLGLRTKWQPVEQFRMKVGGAIWKRAFDNYEARDFNNVWLGEKRYDKHLGIDYELGYRVWRAGARKDVLNAGLWIIAFGAYDRRVSNMARDLSFATNYEIARIYFGIQLENL